MVRELLFLMVSVICVLVRDHGSWVMTAPSHFCSDFHLQPCYYQWGFIVLFPCYLSCKHKSHNVTNNICLLSLHFIWLLVVVHQCSWWSVVQKIYQWQTFNEILNHCCNLDLKASKSDVFTRYSRFMFHQTSFHCKRFCNSVDMIESHILICALTLTFILKITIQSFHKILQLMMMHHHTKLRYKTLSGSKNIV